MADEQVIQDPAGGVHRFPAEWTPPQIHAEMLQRWNDAHPKVPMQPGQSAQPPGTRPGGFQPQPTAPAASMAPLDAEAERAKRIMLLKTMQGDRSGVTGATNLLHSNPTYAHQQEQAKKMGDLAAEQATRQSAGEAILPGVDALRYMVKQAQPEDWSAAAGAYNTTKQKPAIEVPFSPGAWMAPEMTPTQARASYGWNPQDPANQRAWKLQNNLEHLTGALTDQYVAAAGKGIAGSDARMEVFRDLMKAASRAPDQKAAHEILDTAENSIRDMFRLPARIHKGTPEQEQAQYDMLPPGREYVAPDGQTRKKR